MKINRCMGCMAETESYPCPHCGYNGEQNLDHALPCGSILNGRYLVGRVLGQGGFGITYIGWDLSLERKLAIKEYYPGGQVTRTRQTGVSLLWGQTEQAQQLRENGKKTVLHEAQKMAKLEAVPEAVHVRDVFQENDTAYIVMDFVEGETLQHKLKREGPMLWKDAEKLFLPLISAMEKVHAAGIIHRDLSPDNFMLQPDGQARILDLGAAKDIQTSTGASSALVVKNGFSPIEQYGTRGGSGTWTDVYAMAATIYYALTGQVPPAATDRIVKDTMDFTILPVPASVMEALKNALAVKSDERTQTMGQLLREIRPKVPKKEEPKPEPPKEKEYKSEKSEKAEPKKEAPKPEPVRERPNGGKKSKTPLLIAAACVAVALIAVLAAAFGGNTTQNSQASVQSTTAETTENEAEATAEATEETTKSALEIAYKEACELSESGETARAAIAFGKLGDYEDAREKSKELWDKIAIRDTIDAGSTHIVGLKTDGTVIATGPNNNGECDVSDWTEIVAVSAGGETTVGLREDGTVVATGANDYGQLNVSDWTDIVAISAGQSLTVGLKADGTVVATGKNDYGLCDVSGWTDIIAVSAHGYIVGVRSDGIALRTYIGGENLGSWKNLKAVSAGGTHVVGLQNDGSVVAKIINAENNGQCDVSDWENIIAIATGDWCTMGLKADGTVVTVGYPRCDLSNWIDIVAISAHCWQLVGLKADGTVVYDGKYSIDDEWKVNDVSDWSNIKLPNEQ